uniref:50S ribosomal protein L35 n=1 Tax=Sphondylothamnion multifidum TaxID=193186 RepID=A0A4D6X188_9FLOR|nr:ribosomal protein L35 [Sphondylothamnion multifidum]
MYKLKTIKSINKRFKKTSTNKLLKHKSSRSHLLQKKNSKRKQHLRKVKSINFCDRKNLVNGLPYIF